MSKYEQCEWCEKEAYYKIEAWIYPEYVRYACGGEHAKKIETLADLDLAPNTPRRHISSSEPFKRKS